ncbi:MAG TPA: asparagine synthase-related protein, partial [Flavipsychrobacter sp.]
MSAIYGVYNINTEGCESCFRQLAQPFFVADNWIGNNIGLGQRTIYNTQESFEDKYPLEDKNAAITLVGDFRLDDRESLISKLGLHPTTRNTDGYLILEAYKKWGINCTQHLLGDFAFVIWDAKEQLLHCFTDHFATVPLYYYYNGQKFFFASDIRQLVAVDGVPNKINENKLATLVVETAGDMFRTETWFKDIYPVPAATVITVGENGIKKLPYWEPTIGKPLHFKNETDFREAFQDVFFAAVKDRLRSHYPVTALLSGGLDSSSVVAVAAKILERENKELHVFSSVLPDGDNSGIEDERYYIDLFKQFPNINIHYINERDTGFLNNIKKLHSEQTSFPLTSRHYLYDAFAKEATALGSRTILDGSYGELGATHHGHGIYAEQLKNLNWLWLWNELNARKKLTNESVLYNLRYHVLKPFVPEALIYRKRDEANLFKQNKYNFLNPDLSNQLENKLALSKDQLRRRYIKPLTNHRLNQLNTIKTTQHKGNPRMSFETGEYRYPFRDIRVIEFGINAPAQYKIRNGYKRYMVRGGLDGILPKEIQWRMDKKPFSPDYFRRYNSQIGKAKEFLNDISDNDPVRNVVNVDQLKTWANILVSDTEKNNNTLIIALHYLPQGIYLINFLRRF